MKIAFTVQHPANVHIFKHVIKNLQKRGHSVFVFARAAEVTKTLLESYDIDHEMLVSESPTGLLSLCSVQAKYEYRLVRRFKDVQPDVVVSLSGVAASHAAAICGTKNILFINNEHATLENYLSIPFADRVYTPSGFEKDFGSKHHRYDSYDWLAYTHPDYFDPSPESLYNIGLDENSDFVILRLVAWNAAHDVGKKRRNDIKQIADFIVDEGYDIIVSAEGETPPALQKYDHDIHPATFHDLLYYSDMYLGEGAATGMEAALLGTPAIYINELDLGYANDIQQEYGILKDLAAASTEEVCKEVKNMTSQSAHWEEVRVQLVEEKEDMVEIILGSILD